MCWFWAYDTFPRFWMQQKFSLKIQRATFTNFLMLVLGTISEKFQQIYWNFQKCDTWATHFQKCDTHFCHFGHNKNCPLKSKILSAYLGTKNASFIQFWVYRNSVGKRALLNSDFLLKIKKSNDGQSWNSDWMKSVRIRSFSSPYFPTFELNTGPENSEYEHFSRSE